MTMIPPNMFTYSGKEVDYLDISSESIDQLDIAHGLAFMCRFNGQCHKFYSVAEHSCRVASWIWEQGHHDLFMPALMHDAHEAYTPDIVAGLKRYSGDIVAIQDELDRAVAERFRFKYELFKTPEIKAADLTLLATEIRDIMSPLTKTCQLPEPLDGKLVPWGPEFAKYAFLSFIKNKEPIFEGVV